MVQITRSDLSFYAQQGYLIIRRAFSQARIQSLIDAVERLMDRALAGECEIGWIDRDRQGRLPLSGEDVFDIDG